MSRKAHSTSTGSTKRFEMHNYFSILSLHEVESEGFDDSQQSTCENCENRGTTTDSTSTPLQEHEPEISPDGSQDSTGESSDKQQSNTEAISTPLHQRLYRKLAWTRTAWVAAQEAMSEDWGRRVVRIEKRDRDSLKLNEYHQALKDVEFYAIVLELDESDSDSESDSGSDPESDTSNSSTVNFNGHPTSDSSRNSSIDSKVKTEISMSLDDGRTNASFSDQPFTKPTDHRNDPSAEDQEGCLSLHGGTVTVSNKKQREVPQNLYLPSLLYSTCKCANYVFYPQISTHLSSDAAISSMHWMRARIRPNIVLFRASHDPKDAIPEYSHDYILIRCTNSESFVLDITGDQYGLKQWFYTEDEYEELMEKEYLHPYRKDNSTRVEIHVNGEVTKAPWKLEFDAEHEINRWRAKWCAHIQTAILELRRDVEKAWATGERGEAELERLMEGDMEGILEHLKKVIRSKLMGRFRRIEKAAEEKEGQEQAALMQSWFG